MNGIIDTVSAAHLVAPLTDLLKAQSKFVIAGAVAEAMSLSSIPLFLDKKALLF